VGYNAANFDHRFTQFLFYRNLRHPYEWAYRNGNSKWDIINLARAAFVFHGDQFKWPRDEEGRVRFGLEALAEANGIAVEQAHDALSDVRTLIKLAKLIRERVPRLFTYHLSLRRKREVEKILRGRTFIYVSGGVVHQRQTGTIGTCLGSDAKNKCKFYIHDLAHDPRNYDKATDAAGRTEVPGFYTLKSNAAPFVVALDIIDQEPTDPRFDKLDLKLDDLRKHHQLLKGWEGFIVRAAKSWLPRRFERNNETDVDSALYEKFPSPSDIPKLKKILKSPTDSSTWLGIEFDDNRLGELLFRFRARNFPEFLLPDEKERWYEHCRRRIFKKKDGRTALQRYMRDIEEKRKENPPPHIRALLDKLEAYGKKRQEELKKEKLTPAEQLYLF